MVKNQAFPTKLSEENSQQKYFKWKLNQCVLPEVHGARQQGHGDGVDPQEVADEDDAFDSLRARAQPSNRPDVVGDGHQGGPSQVSPVSWGPFVAQVHLAEAAGNGGTGKAEARVVAAVDVSDKFVHLQVRTELLNIVFGLYSKFLFFNLLEEDKWSSSTP